MRVQMGNYTTVSAYCRYLIESGDLRSKLAPPKTASGAPLTMDQPPSCLLTAPTRASHLQMSGDAPKLPKMNQLADKEARAKCLHRFAHHELQAVELFAWAILRWPQMPEALKKGFLNTIAEEQKHLKLYLVRLEAHGFSFGDLPLSDYFWRHVPTLDQSPHGPQAFLSAMGLTLEQANLDFTLMFKKAFEDAGDHETARTLQIVHDDEIGHVRLAKTWLSKLENSPNDLQNYEKTVPFPFGATRAKGRQFFVQPRQSALLDDKFITHVQEAQKEWVKKPVVLFPNFGAEEAHKAKNKEHFYAIKILFEAFWQIGTTREDLHPALKQPNPLVPTDGRLLLFPWLADDAAQKKAHQQDRTLWGPQPHMVEKWHSKNGALQWAQKRGFHPDALASEITFIPPDFFTSPQAEEKLKERITSLMGETHRPITLKPNWGFSGRGRAGSEDIAHFNKTLGAAKRMCHRQKGALLEPWLTRTADYSLLLWLHEDKQHELKIMRLHNSVSGMYCGHSLDVPEKIQEELIQVGNVLAQDLRHDGYVGPVGVDAFTFSHAQGEQLRAVVEINARMTMGHLAWWALSYFKDAQNTLFAFHPKLQATAPKWALQSHHLFEDGPIVFSD